ncbi:MAG: hypothetical protein ACI8X5_004311, partial [Planctomycetota bacterium]
SMDRTRTAIRAPAAALPVAKLCTILEDLAGGPPSTTT